MHVLILPDRRLIARLNSDRLRLPMRLWSIFAGTVALAAVASAQAPGRERASLLLPIAGAPLSAETTEEFVTKNADGTSSNEIATTKEYRDAAGRLRSEWEARDASGGPVIVILIADPWKASSQFLRPPLNRASSPRSEERSPTAQSAQAWALTD